MSDAIDKYLSETTESIARQMNRRRVLSRGIKGGFALVAGITLGQFSNLKSAFAAPYCSCDWAYGHVNCSGSGGYCSGTSCPSGCSVCTTSSGCGTICNYPGGRWVSCTGFGTCGRGYKLCTDCNCNACRYVCTCLSSIVCLNCCTKTELQESLQSLAASPAH